MPVGEGHAVVGANGARQPILTEKAIEEGADPLALGREQAVTAEQVARVLIGNRQRTRRSSALLLSVLDRSREAMEREVQHASVGWSRRCLHSAGGAIKAELM
jgi:hypothetical protein